MIFLGFFISAFIAHWNLKRAEISRTKDVIIEKIEELPSWLSNQLSSSDPYQTEEIYSGKITLLEIRFKQLSSYASYSFSKDIVFKQLRNVDIESLDKEAIAAVSALSFDLIEHIESSYYSRYYTLKKTLYSKSIWAIGSFFIIVTYMPLFIFLYLIFKPPT